MPIGGGTFTVQNKVLPGAYINFVSTGSLVKMGARGVCALALELNWGPEGKAFFMYAEDFNKAAKEVLGYGSTAEEVMLVREALKRANAVLLYRVNGGGAKAAATIGGLTVTAKCGGTRGNDLKVMIQTNVDDETMVDVITYLGSEEVDVQTVKATGGGAALKENAYVTFAGENLTAAAGTTLTGGTNGTVDGSSHAAALTAFEVESFNTIGYCGTDETTKALYGAYVKRLRYDEGRKVVGFAPKYAGDDIGLVNVKNGVYLNDGAHIPADKAVAWVAGASAGAEVNESLTNTAYDDAVDVDEKYTKSQLKAAIEAGEFVFYADDGKARVLSDINSRTTFGNGITEDWTSNRVIRVLDGWAMDIARIFGENYAGQQTNSNIGRNLLKADVTNLGKQYEKIDAISDFSPDDIVITQGERKNAVAAETALKPNDSMEKLYMTVQVN